MSLGGSATSSHIMSRRASRSANGTGSNAPRRSDGPARPLNTSNGGSGDRHLHGGTSQLYFGEKKHGDLVTGDEFQKLWWQVKESRDHNESMAILQNCASFRVLHVKQLESVLKLFDDDGLRMEALEMFLMRAHELRFKADLIPLFDQSRRNYVADLLKTTMMAEPMAGIPMEPLLVNNKIFKSDAATHSIVQAMERLHYNRMNQIEVVSAMLQQDCMILSHKQAYKMLSRFIKDTLTLINVADLIEEFVEGFTVRETALILDDISKWDERFQVLKKLAPMILDAENRWALLDGPFGRETEEIRAKIRDYVTTISVLPRSPIFGSVDEKCVVFVIDTTSSMSATFTTNQGETISRLRFVVRDLCKVLQHQLKPKTLFNIISFSKTFHVFSSTGPVVATRLHVLHGCNWLRTLVAEGPTYPVDAIEAGFEYGGEELEALYLVTDGDPTRGIDTAMQRLTKSFSLRSQQFEILNLSKRF